MLHSLNPDARRVKETAKDQLKAIKFVMNDINLLQIDDFFRSVVLDPLFGFNTSKWFQEVKTAPDHVKEDIQKLVKAHVFEENNAPIRHAMWALLGLYIEDDDRKLNLLINNYMQLFDARSGFTAARCHQFATEQHVGLMMIATKKWETGELLNSHNLDVPFDYLPPGLNEYSVSRPSVGQKDHIWLGPSSICNHSCTPNVVYEHYEKKTLLKVIKTIEIGEEITVHYSNKYFPNCECNSCKSKTGFESKKRVDPALVSSKNLLAKRTRVSNTRITREDDEKQLAETFALYKKMFKGVDYPDEIREKAESAERRFAQRFQMLGKAQIILPLAAFSAESKVQIHRVHISETLLEKDPLNARLTRQCWTNAGKLIEIGTAFMSAPEKVEESDIDDLKEMGKFIEDLIKHKELSVQQYNQQFDEQKLLREKNALEARRLEEAGGPKPNSSMVCGGFFLDTFFPENWQASELWGDDDPDAAETQNDHYLYRKLMDGAKAKTTEEFYPIILRAFSGSNKKAPAEEAGPTRKRRTRGPTQRRKVRREESPLNGGDISDVCMRVTYTNDSVSLLHVKKRNQNEQSVGPSTSANSANPKATESHQRLEDVVNFCLNSPTVM